MISRLVTLSSIITFTASTSVISTDVCQGCEDTCSLLPPLHSNFPCYQGDVKNAVFCYNTDPLLPDGVTWECGTCTQYGYTNYIQNDPIYKNMELWTEGASYDTKETEYPNVKLEVYFEALCPGCQEFTTGALKDVLAMDDIRDITDMKIVPYGNTKQESNGDFTCQHGPDECTTDAYELCTLYKLSGEIESISSGNTAYAAWPFILCMEEAEGSPAMAEECFKSSMAGSGLDWETVATCADQEYSTVQSAGRDATPSHDYVPWVLVDGRVLSQPDLMLLPSICKSYTGPTPASCFKAVNATHIPVTKKCEV